MSERFRNLPSTEAAQLGIVMDDAARRVPETPDATATAAPPTATSHAAARRRVISVYSNALAELNRRDALPH